jgi:uncharacterized membrane protein YraQ (UPF0718 family)
MKLRNESKPLFLITVFFLILYYLPVNFVRLENALIESIYLARWYAREHVITCLVPAFFIAGAISVFISQASVIKYLGPKAKRLTAYSVAAVSGSVLAVCSCTVLPLFAGIYKMGAGLGPATAFLYAGPAVNVLAIILTARVLGLELGIARAVGAVSFSVIIGGIMHFVFRKEESEKAAAQMPTPEPHSKLTLGQNALYFFSMVLILIFANWGKPAETDSFWNLVYASKWIITSASSVLLGLILVAWFNIKWWKIFIAGICTVLITRLFPGNPTIPFCVGTAGLIIIAATSKNETTDWLESSWGFAKQITPLLFYGVLAAGLCLGRPGHEGLIPSSWIQNLVGGNSVSANLFASIVGAFMYFATLTEVPILQGLMGNGMGKGPALALLLSGPALSLPNMLVIRSVLGIKKTFVFVLLVITMAASSGIIYGNFF